MIENTSDDIISDVMIEAVQLNNMKLMGVEDGATIVMIEDLYPGGTRMIMASNNAGSTDTANFNIYAFAGSSV